MSKDNVFHEWSTSDGCEYLIMKVGNTFSMYRKHVDTFGNVYYQSIYTVNNTYEIALAEALYQKCTKDSAAVEKAEALAAGEVTSGR